MSAIVVATAVWNINSHHQGTTRWVFVMDTAPDATQNDAITDAIGSQFTALRSWCADSVALHRGEAQVVEFVNDPTHGHRFHPLSLAYTQPFSINGTGNVASSPQVAYRVTLQTALAGRKYRGRQFLPGVPEDKVDASGTVDSTAAGNAATFSANVGDTIVGAVGALSPVWVTPSFKDATTEPVVSTLGRTQAGTQRRRLKATSIT